MSNIRIKLQHSNGDYNTIDADSDSDIASYTDTDIDIDEDINLLGSNISSSSLDKQKTTLARSLLSSDININPFSSSNRDDGDIFIIQSEQNHHFDHRNGSDKTIHNGDFALRDDDNPYQSNKSRLANDQRQKVAQSALAHTATNSIHNTNSISSDTKSTNTSDEIDISDDALEKRDPTIYKSIQTHDEELELQSILNVGVEQQSIWTDLRGDYTNVVILIMLYILQGLPIGLSQTIPLVMAENNVGFAAQAVFSLASIPFSLKLLWAPLVDSYYFSTFGKRKSWILPTQLLCGLSLLYFASSITIWISGDPNAQNDHIITTPQVNVFALSAYFIFLYFLMATQDIAVDAWALTMLRQRNIVWAGTINNIGQFIGMYLTNVSYLLLSSPTFCTKYLWFFLPKTYNPSTNQYDIVSQGILDVTVLMRICGVMFLVTTAIVITFKQEISLHIYDQIADLFWQLQERKRQCGVLTVPLSIDIAGDSVINSGINNYDDIEMDDLQQQRHGDRNENSEHIISSNLNNNFSNISNIEIDDTFDIENVSSSIHKRLYPFSLRNVTSMHELRALSDKLKQLCANAQKSKDLNCFDYFKSTQHNHPIGRFHPQDDPSPSLFHRFRLKIARICKFSPSYHHLNEDGKDDSILSIISTERRYLSTIEGEGMSQFSSNSNSDHDGDDTLDALGSDGNGRNHSRSSSSSSSSSNNNNDDEGLINTLKRMKSIIVLPNVQLLVIWLLTYRIAVAASDSLTELKLFQRGLQKEQIAYMTSLSAPLTLVVPVYLTSLISRYKKPFRASVIALLPRILVCMFWVLFVAIFPTLRYYEHHGLIMGMLFVLTIIQNLIWLVQMVSAGAFFSLVADPKIAGTFLTMLYTSGNFGSLFTRAITVYLVDIFTISICVDERFNPMVPYNMNPLQNNNNDSSNNNNNNRNSNNNNDSNNSFIITTKLDQSITTTDNTQSNDETGIQSKNPVENNNDKVNINKEGITNGTKLLFGGDDDNDNTNNDTNPDQDTEDSFPTITLSDEDALKMLQHTNRTDSGQIYEYYNDYILQNLAFLYNSTLAFTPSSTFPSLISQANLDNDDFTYSANNQNESKVSMMDGQLQTQKSEPKQGSIFIQSLLSQSSDEQQAVLNTIYSTEVTMGSSTLYSMSYTFLNTFRSVGESIGIFSYQKTKLFFNQIYLLPFQSQSLFIDNNVNNNIDDGDNDDDNDEIQLLPQRFVTCQPIIRPDYAKVLTSKNSPIQYWPNYNEIITELSSSRSLSSSSNHITIPTSKSSKQSLTHSSDFIRQALGLNNIPTNSTQTTNNYPNKNPNLKQTGPDTMCAAIGGTKCMPIVDGYFVEVIICGIFGVFYFFYMWPVLRKLDYAPLSSWRSRTH